MTPDNTNNSGSLMDTQHATTIAANLLPIEILNDILVFLDVKSVRDSQRIWRHIRSDNLLWKRVYFYNFVLPNYFGVVEQEVETFYYEDSDEEEEEEVSDEEEAKPEQQDDQPPVKKRKLEKKLVVVNLSKQEIAEKKKKFFAKPDSNTDHTVVQTSTEQPSSDNKMTDGEQEDVPEKKNEEEKGDEEVEDDEEWDWRRLCILRHKMVQLNSSSVMNTLSELVDNPDQIETATKNILESKSKKKNKYTERQLEVIRYDAVKNMLEMKHWIAHCRHTLSGSAIIDHFLKRNCYYYGIYYQNSTDGAAYNVAMETRFLIFNPDTGIPLLFSGTFTCNGYRGEENYELDLKYQEYIGSVSLTILHRRISSNYSLREQQEAHLGSLRITTYAKGTKVDDSTIHSQLFGGNPVLNLPAAQAELESSLPGALKSIALACDSSYEVYLD